MPRLRPLDLKGAKWNYDPTPPPQQKVIFPCAPGEINDGFHSTVIPRCKKWNCEYCLPLRKAQFSSLVGNAREFHQGFFGMLTITFRQKDGIISSARRQRLKLSTVKKYAQKVVTRAQTLANGFEYIKVPERTKAGIPHFHVLCFGIQTQEFQRWQYALREFHKSQTGGLSHQIDFQQGYGNPANYLAKYLGKDDALPEGFSRRFSTSRGLFRLPDVSKMYSALFRLLSIDKANGHSPECRVESGVRLCAHPTGGKWQFGSSFLASFETYKNKVSDDGEYYETSTCNHPECELVPEPRRSYLRYPRQKLSRWIQAHFGVQGRIQFDNLMDLLVSLPE